LETPTNPKQTNLGLGKTMNMTNSGNKNPEHEKLWKQKP
jgi:hypothetical protein